MHRVVIVGGGVAGLDLATRLPRAGGLAVTLVDREPAYVWKPMLHTVAAGTSTAALQETVYAAQALAHGFRFELGQAISIDRGERTIALAPLTVGDEVVVPARSLGYDTLVLAAGSRANDFGVAGVVEYCVTIDGRSDAIGFNDRLRVALIRAAVSGATLGIGIVGGGATGVELAAELIQVTSLAERLGVAGAAARLRVALIETAPRLLGAFPEKISEEARKSLVGLGVDVHLGSAVERVDERGFMLADGTMVPADLKVWAAGVRAPALLDALPGMTRDRSGRIIVDETMRSVDNPAIFAVGDCASVTLNGVSNPPTAQAASQHARYLARQLPRLVAGKDAPAATYRDFGALVSLGGYDAYGTLGRYGLFRGGFIRGRVAQLGHAMLYRSYQARLHGPWRGAILWAADMLGRKVRPAARLS